MFSTAGVLDSVREAKKLNEAAYHVIENEVSNVSCHQMKSTPRNFADGRSCLNSRNPRLYRDLGSARWFQVRPSLFPAKRRMKAIPPPRSYVQIFDAVAMVVANRRRDIIPRLHKPMTMERVRNERKPAYRVQSQVKSSECRVATGRRTHLFTSIFYLLLFYCHHDFISIKHYPFFSSSYRPLDSFVHSIF